MPVSYKGLLYPITQPVTPPLYQRPSDWLILPVLIPGEEKFVGLFPVYDDDSNFLAVYFEGDYVVDWGDGATESFLSGETAEHTYNFAAINPDTLTTMGYKQVIVTVTPQNPGELTLIDLTVRHTNISGYYATCPWLDIGLSMPNCSEYGILLSNNNYLGSLESITVYDTGGCISLYEGFYYCYSLKRAEIKSMPNMEQIDYLFYSCYSLSVVLLPELPYSSYNLFEYCGCISYVSIDNIENVEYPGGLIGYPEGIRKVRIGKLGADASNLFYYNYALETVTIEDASMLESAETMFYELPSLSNILLPPTPNLTDAFAMFLYCNNLETVQFSDLSSLENGDYMFANCYSLRNILIPPTPILTSIYSIFSQSPAIEDVVFQDLSSLEDMYYAFLYCHGLRNVVLPNVPQGVSMEGTFYECPSISTLQLGFAPGNLNATFAACTNLVTLSIEDASMFSGDLSTFSQPLLAYLRVPGIEESFLIENCSMSREALVQVFHDLATIPIGSQTVTITGNWGTSELSPSDLEIATDKGWNVTTS